MDFHAPSYPQCFRRCVTRAETMTGKRTPKRRNWHYGRDDSEVLVIRAPSVAMNPTLMRS